MEKDRDDLVDKLFAEARKSGSYNQKMESGFEQRVMAKIRAGRQQQKTFQFWAWRLIPAFCSIVLALGIWSYTIGKQNVTDLSALTSGNEEKLLVAYLTGE